MYDQDPCGANCDHSWQHCTVWQWKIVDYCAWRGLCTFNIIWKAWVQSEFSMKEMYPSLIFFEMLILDSTYPYWSIVCYLFWKASWPAYSFYLLIFLCHHSKFSIFVQWSHQITILHLWIKLDIFSSYIRFHYMTMGIIIGVDIVIYILMLLWIPHFNGNSIK
jgi:hypothetical protein